MRDLGTEGAGYADVGLKQAIDEGIVPGPRMLVATRAIVATGSYGPKGFEPGVEVPQGAEEASGEDIVRAVRRQIAAGADVVKLYADYRWRPGEDRRPDDVGSRAARRDGGRARRRAQRRRACHDRGRHAPLDRGRRRHDRARLRRHEGDLPRDERSRRRVVPDARSGRRRRALRRDGTVASLLPAAVELSRASFKAARAANVTICAGGDVGVFAHGENVRELELMQDAGMPAREVLMAVTSVNARAFRIDDRVGAIRAGLIADLVAVARRSEQSTFAPFGRCAW